MEKNIKKILETLNKNNYQAYLVGGYVRDFLLGINSFDVDIATDALPKDIHRIFNSSKSNYGSVNFLMGKYNIDITTFREDLNYVNRKPSTVNYITSLEKDLTRRDFTINAICMNKDGKIIDPMHGCDDLDKRLIRMIGDIDTKLKEDPLRIMRAIRFSAILNFDIEENLYEKIKENKDLVKTLSSSRIKEELDRIFMSKNFKKAIDIFKDTKINEVLGIDFGAINYVDDPIGMWAQVKVSNIPFTNAAKGNIIKITEVLDFGRINNEILYKYGLYVSMTAGKILNINPKNITKMYNKLPIKSREDIDIDTKYISDNFGTGKIIGSIYQDLESSILKGKLKNKKKLVAETIFIKEALKLNLSLNEFLLLLYFDNSYDSVFDIALLSKTLNMSEEQILSAYGSLMAKKLIKVVAIKDGYGKVIEKVSLDNFYNEIKTEYKTKEEETKKEDIYSIFEKEFGRTLSSMDYEIINAWIDNGFSEDLVIAALKEAVYNGVPNLRYIDKVLYEWNRKGIKKPTDIKKQLESIPEAPVYEASIMDFDWLNEK